MMKYRFCPYCSGDIVSIYLERDRKKAEICAGCGRTFYHNSKPCVGALIVNGDKVLLVRRSRGPYKGYWDIPGGFLMAGEHPEEGLAREIMEETGLKVRPTELLGIFMDRYGSEAEDTLNIHYIAEIVGGEGRPGSDAIQLKWFFKESLPKKLAFRNSREALRVWQERNA